MSAPTGPSYFQDITSCTYNSLNIYSIESIEIGRNESMLMGYDNTKIRPVATHISSISETVTLTTQDLYAIQQLLGMSGAHNLVFNTVPMNQQNNGTALPAQTVTVHNVVWQNKSLRHPTKQIHSFSITGIVLEVSDDSDPIVIAAAS